MLKRVFSLKSFLFGLLLLGMTFGEACYSSREDTSMPEGTSTSLLAACQTNVPEKSVKIICRDWQHGFEMDKRDLPSLNVLTQQAQNKEIEAEGNKHYWFEKQNTFSEQSDAIVTLMAIYSGYFDLSERDSKKYEYWSDQFDKLVREMSNATLIQHEKFCNKSLLEINAFFEQIEKKNGEQQKFSSEMKNSISLCAIMMHVCTRKEIPIIANQLTKKAYYIINPFFNPAKTEEINAKVLSTKNGMVYFEMYQGLCDQKELEPQAMHYLKEAAKMDLNAAKITLKRLENSKNSPSD